MKGIQQLVALILGIVFLLIGILGFIPALVPNDNLLGIFSVNGVHNIVHLLIGILGIAAALSSQGRLFNQVIGIVYLLIGILGFVPVVASGDMLLGLVRINLADNLLHIVVGLLVIVVGFAIKENITRSEISKA